MVMSQIFRHWVEVIISIWKSIIPQAKSSTGNQLNVFRDVAEELYFWTNNSKSIEERKAIKGVQHAIEEVIKRHGEQTFKRPTPSLRYNRWLRKRNVQ